MAATLLAPGRHSPPLPSFCLHPPTPGNPPPHYSSSVSSPPPPPASSSPPAAHSSRTLHSSSSASSGSPPPSPSTDSSAYSHAAVSSSPRKRLTSSRSAVSLRNAYNRLRAPSPVRVYPELTTAGATPVTRPKTATASTSATPEIFALLASTIAGHDVACAKLDSRITATTSTKTASPPARAQTAPVERPQQKARSHSFRSSIMSSAAKNFFHDKLGSHHPHLPRSSRSTDKPAKVTDDPDYERKHDEEKHFICQFDKSNQEVPLSPSEVARDPSEKRVGHSSKYLKAKDFKLVKTIGTGTFARVWLAKLAQPPPGDENKVFALKILRKVDVIKLKQVEHVRNERQVLSAVAGHPFITTMVASFSDHENLYMIMDYCPGGEIFTYLRRHKKFKESTAQFYAAEVVMILEFLHEKEGVAYRDLKPENILIDAEGHLKLVDFGFAKKLDGRQTWTLCGTPEYLAPETIRNTGHGRAVDWWAFGILVYEFLVGQPPFWDDNPMKLYEQIVKGKIHFPSEVSEDAKDLIGKLCEPDPAKRIGNLRGGAQDVKQHPWFKDIDFGKLYRREVKGPIIPQLKGNDDTRNFESYDGEAPRRTVYSPDLQKKYDQLFECF